MKKFFFIASLIFCFYSSSIYSMVTSLKHTSRLGYSTPRISRITKVKPIPMQKRTVWSSHTLGELSKNIPPQLEHFSPVHGAAIVESNVLQNLLLTEPIEPRAINSIAKELFFRLNQTEPVRVTNNKSKAAYALEPEVIGKVMGALEKGVLGNEQVKKNIIALWQSEYTKKTMEKKNFSYEKINNLINLFIKGYEENKNTLFSLLLGFLYLKANPDNNHDMIHFLIGLNTYVPLGFEVSKELYRSFTDQSGKYIPQDYTDLKTALISIPNAYARINYAKANIPLTISTLLEEKRRFSYAPKTIFGSYGYEGQPAVSSCTESALRDIWNNLLYNQANQEFDLSLLPNTLSVRNQLKEFYQKYKKTDTVNSYASGQAFMNLVSGIPKIIGISYVKGNYELKSIDTEANFIKLFNYFFGTRSTNFNELASHLSDTRRTITFDLQLTDPAVKKIIMIIEDHIKNEKRHISLCFSFGHSWTEYGAEDNKENLLDAEILSFEYGKQNPTIRSLFYVHLNPKLSRTLLYESQKKSFDPSILYALPAGQDYQKISIIRDILFYKKHEALDYAYGLFKSLSNKGKIALIPEILQSAAFQERLEKDKKFNQEFNTVIADNLDYIFDTIIEDVETQNKLLKKLENENVYKQYYGKWMRDEELKKRAIKE